LTMGKLGLRLFSKPHDIIEVDVVSQWRVELKSGLFRVSTPMGDDWMQTVDFDLGVEDVWLSEYSASLTVLTFSKVATLEKFRDWLPWANEASKEGHRTMRG